MKKKDLGLKLGNSNYVCVFKSFDFGNEFIWKMKISTPLGDRFYERTFSEETCEKITGKRDNRSFHDIIVTSFDSPNSCIFYDYFFVNPPLPKNFSQIENDSNTSKNPTKRTSILVFKITTSLPVSRKRLKLTYWVTLLPENTMKKKIYELSNKVKNNEEEIETLKKSLTQEKSNVERLESKLKSKEVLVTEMFHQMKNQSEVLTDIVQKMNNEEKDGDLNERVIELEEEVETFKKKLEGYYCYLMEKKREFVINENHPHQHDDVGIDDPPRSDESLMMDNSMIDNSMMMNESILMDESKDRIID